MSMADSAGINCNQCGERLPFKKWDSLNSELNPKEKELLIEGELFKASCPKCGFEHMLNYTMMYHDRAHGVMIQLVFDESGIDQIISGLLMQSLFSGISSIFPGMGMESKTAGYQTRVVKNHQELREKAMIFDCGFDDRIMEILKLTYKLLIAAQAKSADMIPEALYFQRHKPAHQFIIKLKNGDYITTDFPEELYEITAKDIKDKLDSDRTEVQQYITDKFIDEKWAANFIDSLKPVKNEEKILQENDNPADSDTDAPKQVSPPAREAAAKEYVLGTGNHYVGEDIPAGRYDIIWVSDSGFCSVYDEQGKMLLYEYFSNDNVREYKNAELIQGGKVNLGGNVRVKFIMKKVY